MHSVNSKDSKSSPPVFPSASRNSLGATELVKNKMLEDTADKLPDPRFNSSRHSLYQSSRRPILPLFSLTDTLHYWSQPHPLTKRLQGHLKLSYHDNRNGQSVRGQWYGLLAGLQTPSCAPKGTNWAKNWCHLISISCTSTTGWKLTITGAS